MKKSIIFILTIFCLSVVLIGCGDSGKISKAQELIDQEQWQEAVNILDSIKETEETNQLYIKCQMHINSDANFLETLEKSVLERMVKASEGTYDVEELINTELAYLEKYRNASFYDKQIEHQKDNYLTGLDEQKASLKELNDWEYFLKFQPGYIKRLEALTVLYNDYDFCKDNASFVANYIMKVEEAKRTLDAFNEIEEDISNQMNGDDAEWDGNGYGMGTIVLTNNTNYTFDGYLTMIFYNGDTKVDSYTSYVEKVTPGQRYTHTFFFRTDVAFDNLEWESYEYNISFND